MATALMSSTDVLRGTALQHRKQRLTPSGCRAPLVLRAVQRRTSGPESGERKPLTTNAPQRRTALHRRDLVAGVPILSALALCPLPFRLDSALATGETSLYDFTVTQYGKPLPLDKFRGLRELYNKYHNDGFEVVAFPANQFGCQAPGTSDEERQYAIKKFGFEFPVMDKIAVKKKPTPQCRFSTSIGTLDTEEALLLPPAEDPTPLQDMDPVYAFLKQKPFDYEIEWNYTKFLVGRDGKVLARYKPAGPLEQGMEADVKAALLGKPLPNKRDYVFGKR